MTLKSSMDFGNTTLRRGVGPEQRTIRKACALLRFNGGIAVNRETVSPAEEKPPPRFACADE